MITGIFVMLEVNAWYFAPSLLECVYDNKHILNNILNTNVTKHRQYIISWLR